MKIQIRDATEKDIPFIGWVQLAAARGHVKRGVWDVMCGRDDRCLEWLTRMAATEEPRSWTRWSNFIVAEVDGQAAAALEGFDPKISTMKYLLPAIDDASHEMGWGGEIDQINARFMPLASCMHDYEEGAWIVENVACDAKFRRKGLVNMLLEEIFKRGRERKLPVAQLSVFIGNTAAITAYEKQGFRIADEKRSSEWEAIIGCPGQYKMLREL